MSNGIKYIQFEAGAFIGDIDFQVMTPRQRGVYISLILYLYVNEGALPNIVQTLLKLCNSTDENFTEDWEVIKHKFIVTDDVISHKRVSEELERANSYREKKRLAGIKSGLSRRNAAQTQPEQCSISDGTHPQLRKGKETKRNVKERKEKKDVTDGSPFSSEDRLSVVSQELKFVLLSTELFGCAKTGDKTTLKNISKHLANGFDSDDRIFSKAYKVAQECKKTGDKPIALFIARMKEDFNYRKVAV